MSAISGKKPDVLLFHILAGEIYFDYMTAYVAS